MNNKIILKIRSGSHLYGTNTKDSDKDYLGVYLNTKEELLGLQTSEELTDNIVSKAENGRNNKDAVDCKYYELRKFCRLAMNGNPTVLEILFVNKENIIEITKEGEELLKLRQEFVSKRIYNSFMGYAFAQKKKAFDKSENINHIERFYNWTNTFVSVKNSPISNMTFNDFYNAIKDKSVFENHIKFFKNEHNDMMFQCGDLIFPMNILMKKLKDSLKQRLDKASWRKNGMLQYGCDYKFMSHNVRLLLEGIELMNTKNLILPLSYKDLILKIKTGNMNNQDIVDLMDTYETELHKYKENNNLPDKADYNKINNFIINTYYNYLKEKRKCKKY